MDTVVALQSNPLQPCEIQVMTTTNADAADLQLQQQHEHQENGGGNLYNLIAL